MKKIFVLLLSMLLLLSGCSTEKNEASTRYLTTMDTVMTLTGLTAPTGSRGWIWPRRKLRT